jgi:hypothetical protein
MVLVDVLAVLAALAVGEMYPVSMGLSLGNG